MAIVKSHLKVLLAVVSALVAVGLAELAARALLPHSTKVGRPMLHQVTTRGIRLTPNTRLEIKNHYASHRDIQVTVNSLGYRGAEIETPKPKDVLRILALGDSITLSASLPEEETFVGLLRTRLRPMAGQRIEVLNAGVEDIGLREEIDILEETIDRAQPDVVLLNFYLNDSRPPWGFTQELGHESWARRYSVLWDTIYRRFLLRNWIKDKGSDRFAWATHWKELNWKSDPQAFKTLASMARYDWGAAWNGASWESVEKELDRLKELSAKHHFQVAVAIFPVRFQVESDFEDTFPQWAMTKLAQEKNFPVLDLLPTFRKHRTGPVLFFDQCHPTPHGQSVVAEALAPFLQAQIQKK